MLLPVDRPAELHVEVQWTALSFCLLYRSQIQFIINERFCHSNSLHLIIIFHHYSYLLPSCYRGLAEDATTSISLID
ncbi:hypothetical protein VN97_g1047 [Penicillium thymicola]|uniref:Uncharacterized protein n=1 Tax=Penicillium thymicola TaxID=293382 RepID=A0AAI9TRM8_PENTH|nr:hypothetical protein VN97_g1047 [Penicillium thymicola]